MKESRVARAIRLFCACKMGLQDVMSGSVALTGVCERCGSSGGPQAPAWEPWAYKLQLAIPGEAGASNIGFPSRSLGTRQNAIPPYDHRDCALPSWGFSGFAEESS
jgi:hypothetical protein